MEKNIHIYRRTYYEMQKTRLDEYLRDPQFDSSALPARTFDMSGLPSNNYGQQNNYYLYTTQFPDQYPTQVPSQVKLVKKVFCVWCTFDLNKWKTKKNIQNQVTIMKTRLFKYTENFTTKNWKFSDKKFWYFSYFCLKHR